MDPELIFSAHADADGAGRRTLAARCRAGYLIRLRRGVYIDARIWHRLQPWEREHVRIRAALAQVQGRRVPIQESAAVLWGLPVVHRPRNILLLAEDPTHGRQRAGLRWSVRRLLEPLDTVASIPVTSRAQTALDMAAYLRFEQAVPAMDHVLRPDSARRLPALTKEHLHNLASGLPGLTKQERARRVIGFADARSESPGESCSRALMHLRGFPAPQLQYQFDTPSGRFRTDFCWPERRLAGEFDGDVKYGRGNPATPASWDILVREKRREDAIRATGVGFVRWSWADLSRPAQHPESLVQRLVRAGLDWPGR